MPLRMIITTANKVSRASRSDCSRHASMMAAMLATLDEVTDRVSSNVPKGSPKGARPGSSACRTTASDEPRIAANSHRKDHAEPERMAKPADSVSARSRKASESSRLKPRNHS